jgi:A/G-specific adenine glycosylase
MELGATVCLPRNPKCGGCPIREHCAARRAGTVESFPRVAPRKPVREVRRVAVVLASSHEVLLARRRRDALFGGLWEPPSTEGALSDLTGALGIRTDDLESMGEVTHVLSHRRLEVAVMRGSLRRRQYGLPGAEYDDVRRVAFEQLSDIGRSRLAKRILEVANVALRGLL